MVDGIKKSIPIKGDIYNLTGMSSHATGQEIVDMMLTAEKKKLKNVIIVHGDLDRSEGMRELFLSNYKNINVYIPKSNQKIKLC